MLFVQLSTWDDKGEYESSPLAAMRNEQYAIAAQHPSDFAMVTAADLGDPTSPYNPIHPRNKEEVARRLALAAGSLLYNNPVQHMGAMPLSCTALPDPAFGFKVRIKFDGGGGALHLQVGAASPLACDGRLKPCVDIITSSLLHLGHSFRSRLKLAPRLCHPATAAAGTGLCSPKV